MSYDPGTVLAGALTVSVAVPEVAMLLAEIETINPAGNDEFDSVTGPVNPLRDVTVTVLVQDEPPVMSEISGGLAMRLKSGPMTETLMSIVALNSAVDALMFRS